MQVTMSFPEAELAALLDQFQRATGKSWPEVLHQQGRLVAVNLAHNTQPYGFSATARAMGERAVMRDIGRVYWDISTAFAFLREKSEKAARVFWRALIHNKIDLARNILAANGLDVRLDPTLAEDLHQQRKNRQGRVAKSKNIPSQIVTKGKAIDRYAKKIAKRVGLGKSGFATCADALGGMRGIPHWAKRGRGPGSVDDQSRALNNPHVTIKNDVEYIGQICKPAAVTAATRIQREKMQKHMEKVVHHAGRKSGMK